MVSVDYILDGLNSYLELQRELGNRIIECDRSLLTPKKEVTAPPAVELSPAPEAERSLVYDYVFLHDRPLSAAGAEMIAKIISAMGGTAEKNPLVTMLPLPKAKVYIVLGALALRRFFPGVSAGVGQWIKVNGSETALVTYSPEYILRFGAVTAAVAKIKKDMWLSLKTVLQRIN